ncbi:MAG: hypothetical protein J3Q66DRAFT_333500 [Benniella sp.]|nr:MAG: hypothetical protein J3Q66DRAFT_333500 [Benniella sp.]
MVKLTCLIAATVAMVVPLSVAAQEAGCLRMNERFSLKSDSEDTFVVMDSSGFLMSGPGPLREPPLVMCATEDMSIACSDDLRESICLSTSESLTYIRVEFPTGAFGFLSKAFTLPMIQVTSGTNGVSHFVVLANQFGNQTRIAYSNGMHLQAGSNPDGTPKFILLESSFHISRQLFNIIKKLT